MTQKEALEKLSKEEIAEVVAEGQRVIAKEDGGKVRQETVIEETIGETQPLEVTVGGEKIPSGAPATPKETPELKNEDLTDAFNVLLGKRALDSYKEEYRATIQSTADVLKKSLSKQDIDEIQAGSKLGLDFKADDIRRRAKLETPEATPAPKTDAEIEALSDDELLAELGVEIPKTKPNVQTFYHGTDADFDVFDMTKLGKAQGFGESGFFLHSDPKGAVVYDKRFNRKSKFSLTADEKAVNESIKPLEFEVDTSKALTVSDVRRLKSEGKIKADVDFEGHVRPESYFDNNRDAWKEAMEVTGKKVAVVKAEGSQIVLFNDPKVAKRVKKGRNT
jgi:hypothetical protein